MSQYVTLHNRGQRIITVAGHEFKPGTSVEFTADVADRLRKLYPDEVQAPTDALKPFRVAPAAAAPEPAKAPEAPKGEEEPDAAAAKEKAEKEAAEKAAKDEAKKQAAAEKKAKADAEKAAKAAKNK